MKRTILPIVALAAAAGTLFAADALKDEQDKNSYAIGVDVGRTLQRMGVELDPAWVARGLGDALSGGNQTLLTDEQVTETLQALMGQVRARGEERRKAEAAQNAAAGEKFLADNKGKEGVKTTPSGLQYLSLSEGKGPKPKSSDVVKVHYRGTLVSGKEFDSSYSRNEPAEFRLDQVIPGWTEGVQLMNVGSKYKFFIPPQLAYGENAPPAIGPNQTLLFDVELLSIEKPEASEPERQ